MKNGSVTLMAVVLSVCFVAGGVSGVAVAVVVEGPEAIHIPEGTLIVPENGEPYYYFENGIVITNQVFEVAIDNYENFVIVWPDNYAIEPGENIYVMSVPHVDVTIWHPEDVEWQECYNWLEIEGWPDTIMVDWPVEGPYEYEITTMYVIYLSGRIEKRMVFALRQ